MDHRQMVVAVGGGLNWLRIVFIGAFLYCWTLGFYYKRVSSV